jgi:hypothetical protein
VESNLQFDEATHAYFVDGHPLPSVTKILKDLQITGSDWWRPGDAERGTAIHGLCQQIAELEREGKYEWNGEFQYPELVGYGHAFLSCLRKFRLFPVEMEKRVYHKAMGYAGTIDLIATTGGLGNDPKAGFTWIIDLKRTIEPVSVGIQLSGYGMCQLHGARKALELHEDGTFKLEDFSHRKHETEWVSCLNTWKLLERLGKVKA